MLMSLSGVKQGTFRSACLQDCTGLLLSGVKHGTFRSACLHDCTCFLLSGVKHGTFHSACLPDGYNGTWKHGGHDHIILSVLLLLRTLEC